jgi:hypothetical protein
MKLRDVEVIGFQIAQTLFNRFQNSFFRPIGIEEKEEGPIYYRKESETKFVLWFGTILGESVTYNSDTKEWK